jgi:hypothetical protein
MRGTGRIAATARPATSFPIIEHILWRSTAYPVLPHKASDGEAPVSCSIMCAMIVHKAPPGEYTSYVATREIVQAGGLLDVDVLNHLVIGVGRWVSLRQKGFG